MMKQLGSILAAAFLSILTATASAQSRPHVGAASDRQADPVPAKNQNAALAPRAILRSPEQLELPPSEQFELVVKFRDDVKLRLAPNNNQANVAVVSQTGANLDALRHILAQHGASLSQLLNLPETKLTAIERRAAQRSGKAQPDLAGMMRATAPADQYLPLAQKLNILPIVEFVQFVALAVPPPCDDISPATPSYLNRQTYRNRNPGLGISCAWMMGAARGDGVKLADCEYGVHVDHEDLCNITIEPGQTIHPSVFTNGYADHGTAVAGVIASLENNYGCVGLAPNVDYYHFPEWSTQQGLRRVNAIASAVAAMDAGDVILLEMQAFGPGNIYVPAEYELAVWTLTRTAVDSGIIVVAAAGNGAANLDSSSFNSYNARGDSGAIIVGGGSADTSHQRLSTSTYGSRVNVQGWSSGVFSTGYGNFAQHGGDINQRYTHVFSGTSSASAMIAGACAMLQSMAIEHLSIKLTPQQMRDVLIETGWPQGGNTAQHIGPFPYVPRAALAIGIDFDDCGGNGYPNICKIADGTVQDTNNDLVPDHCQASGDLTGDGVIDVDDLFVLLSQWGHCTPGCTAQCSADFIDPNCAVGPGDLFLLLANWSD